MYTNQTKMVLDGDREVEDKALGLPAVSLIHISGHCLFFDLSGSKALNEFEHFQSTCSQGARFCSSMLDSYIHYSDNNYIFDAK